MSKLNKYLKSIAGGKKGYKKLLKSAAKEWEKSGLFSDADLSSVAGGIDWIELPLKLFENIPCGFHSVLFARLLRGVRNLSEDVKRAPERFDGTWTGGRPINYFAYF